MYYVRQVEMKIANEYPNGLMRTPVHLCVGQEAVPVGIAEHLTIQDKVLSYHRSHGHYLTKGGNLEALFAEILGRQTGCAKGRGGSQHLIDLDVNFIASAPILGGTVPVAAGIAYSHILNNLPGVVIAYVGDAVLEEGILFETLSFSSLHSLPILFIVENNRLSVHTPIHDRQPNRKFKDIGPAFGLSAEAVDGNDIQCVSQVGGKHIEYIRQNKKPSLLCFETFRKLEHVGPNQDFELNYRDPFEVEKWMQRDPLEIALQSIRTPKNIEDFREQINLFIENSWNLAIKADMAQN